MAIIFSRSGSWSIGIGRIGNSPESGRTVLLAPGSYNLSQVTPRELPHVRWEKVFDGQEVLIEGVEGLTLRGGGTGACLAAIESVIAPSIRWP